MLALKPDAAVHAFFEEAQFKELALMQPVDTVTLTCFFSRFAPINQRNVAVLSNSTSAHPN